MIRLKVNGKSRKVATTYGELEFGKLQKLAGLTSAFDIVSVLLELTEDEKEKEFDITGAALVMRAVNFLEKPLPDAPLPSSIEFQGSQVKIKNLETLPISAYKDMQAMAKTKEGLEVHKYLVGIYLQSATSELYNFGKVEPLLEEVEKLSCLEVLSIANFFLRRLAGLRSGTVKIASHLSLVRWKLWQGLTNLKDSISLIYYRIYVAILIQIEKRF